MQATTNVKKTDTQAMIQPYSPPACTQKTNPIMIPKFPPMTSSSMITERMISLQLRGQQFSGTPAKCGLQAPKPLVQIQSSSLSTESFLSSANCSVILQNNIQITRRLFKKKINLILYITLLQNNKSFIAFEIKFMIINNLINKPCYKYKQIQCFKQKRKSFMSKPRNRQHNTEPATIQQHSKQYPHLQQHLQEYGQQYDEYERDESEIKGLPSWRKKEQRKKFRKQIFGDHYNYNYKKPNQNKKYRVQENRNTEIERANRILLQKIQQIFKRSMGKQKKKQVFFTEHEREERVTEMTSKTNKGTISDYKQGSMMKERHNTETQNIKQPINRTNRKSVQFVGGLNKNIEEARQQIIDKEEKASMIRMNRNNIKLGQIEKSMIHKRQRGQTDLQKNRKGALPKKANDYDGPAANKGLQNSNIRKVVGSRSEMFSNISKPSLPKIILFKTSLVINHKQYKLQVSVFQNTYSINAISMRNNQPFQELITMPYYHYQQFYKIKLGQCHQNIIQYIELDPNLNLLKIKGFESKYMDIFQYGEIQLKATDPDEQKVKRDDKPNVRRIQQKQNQGSSLRESSDQLSQNNIIVHFNNNKLNDDTFDRISYVQSDHNTNFMRENKKQSTPGPIQTQSNQESSHTKNMNERKQATKDDKFSHAPSLLNSRVSNKKVQPKLSTNIINIKIDPIEEEKQKKDEAIVNPQNTGFLVLKDQQKQIVTPQVSNYSDHISLFQQLQTRPKQRFNPYNQDQYQNLNIIED